MSFDIENIFGSAEDSSPAGDQEEPDISLLMGPAEEAPSLDEQTEEIFIGDLGAETEEDFFGEPESPAGPQSLPENKPFDEPKGDPDGRAKPGQKDPFSKDSILGLMTYLKELSNSLPEKKKEDFMQSDARLSMEYVINTLKGKKGLLKEIKSKILQKAQPSVPDLPALSPVTKEKIAGTLSYLENLSAPVIEDKNLFAAIRQKLQSITSKIKEATDKRQKEGAN